MWTHEEAVELCKLVEAHCPAYGCHVALTGGSLYKEGSRKDVDLLFYRIRQVKNIDISHLRVCLSTLGIEIIRQHGWVYKAIYKGKSIDLLFPEYKEPWYKRWFGSIPSDKTRHY